MKKAILILACLALVVVGSSMIVNVVRVAYDPPVVPPHWNNITAIAYDPPVVPPHWNFIVPVTLGM